MKRALLSLFLLGAASATAHAYKCDVATVCVRNNCSIELVCWEDPITDPPQTINLPAGDGIGAGRGGVKITEGGDWYIVSFDQKSVTTDPSIDCNSEIDIIEVAASRAETFGPLPLGSQVVVHVEGGHQKFVKANNFASGALRWTPTTQCITTPDHSGNN